MADLIVKQIRMSEKLISKKQVRSFSAGLEFPVPNTRVSSV
jgi:hypothetical protein